MKSILVFCGASAGHDALYTEQAFAFGKALAERNIQLIYGGASIGMMGAVAQGCLEHGGKVVGIIPSFFVTKEVAHEGLSEMIVVKSMHERKLLMYKMTDAAVALPGGFGTLDELFEILTWSQLGMHQMPVGLLNINGYFDHLLEFTRNMHNAGFISSSDRTLLSSSGDIDELLQQFQNYQAENRKVWITLDEL